MKPIRVFSLFQLICRSATPGPGHFLTASAHAWWLINPDVVPPRL